MDFFVAGKPVAKARPRVGKHGTYTPANTREWEELVAWSAKAKMGATEPMQERLRVHLVFFGASKISDLDNLAKSVLDAMNGLVYKDDSQIDRLVIERSGIDPLTWPGVNIGVFVL